MTKDVWLVQHPYLQQVADLQALIDSAVAEIPISWAMSASGSFSTQCISARTRCSAGRFWIA